MSESLEFYVRDLCWGLSQRLTSEICQKFTSEIFVRDLCQRFISEIYISDLCQIYIMSEIYARDYIRDYVTCVGLQPATLLKKILRYSWRNFKMILFSPCLLTGKFIDFLMFLSRALFKFFTTPSLTLL